MGNAIAELLERLIGPFLFAVSITVLIISFDSMTSLLQTAESLSIDDPAYSQKAVEIITNEFTVEDVISLVLSQPDIPVTVETTGESITYTFLESGEILVKKEETNPDDFSREITQIILHSINELDLQDMYAILGFGLVAENPNVDVSNGEVLSISYSKK